METHLFATREIDTKFIVLNAWDATAIAELTAGLRARASASNHRLALVIAGSRNWTISAAIAALSPLAAEKTVWLTEQRVESQRLPISHGERLLGSELDNLVYDAHDGFDPDSFGAALGALRGGGMLLLMMPSPKTWPQLPDPQSRRNAVHPVTFEQETGRFVRRLSRIVTGSDAVTLISESDPISQDPLQRDTPSDPVPASDGDCRTKDQQRAVDAILKTANGRARRPLVLTSDRGRGKTSALGIAAAELLRHGERRILVTAPRRAAVEPLFRHASRQLPDGETHRNRISRLGALLEFLPPDELCRSRRPADLLLVDEAAGIPAPLLEKLLREYARVVFATTVHGYEGTGRGFEVRFRRTLDALTPGWREMRMETPIRWALGDPLEKLVSSALLLDAAPVDERHVARADPKTCKFRHLDRDTLAGDEATLSQLFGLLVLAHYQTRPMDLRHLMDGPNIRVYGLFHEKQVAATALVAIEGSFSPDLATEIFAGRRRPRGHLLPQTLSAHAGIEEATELSYARLIRVAVHPGIQGRGLGRSLLGGIVEHARTEGLDLVGSSFGATKDLLDFWEKCGFVPMHLGTGRNAASGAHAAVVLQPLSPAGETLQALALRRLGERLPSLLAGPLSELEPEIAACLLKSAPTTKWLPDPRERRELESFALERRPYESALPLLVRLFSSRLGPALSAGVLDDRERDTLIGRVLQHRDSGEVARLASLTGKAEVTALLRKATGKIIACEIPEGPTS